MAIFGTGPYGPVSCSSRHVGCLLKQLELTTTSKALAFSHAFGLQFTDQQWRTQWRIAMYVVLTLMHPLHTSPGLTAFKDIAVPLWKGPEHVWIV